MDKKQKFSDQLRQAIRNADRSRYQIAQESRVGESSLSRFVNESAGLTLESIDKIADCLDLEIRAKSKQDAANREKYSNVPNPRKDCL